MGAHNFTNSLVIDFPQNDPGLMYEILVLFEAFAIYFCPCFLEVDYDGTALLSGRLRAESVLSIDIRANL